MSHDTTLEALIERCVAAGIEARRACTKAEAVRAEALARDGVLTPKEAARLAPLEAEAARLNRIYMTAYGPLYAASPTRFRARFVEVCNRIAARVVDLNLHAANCDELPNAPD